MKNKEGYEKDQVGGEGKGKGKTVAVKQWMCDASRGQEAALNGFREYSHEIFVMATLNHPNLLNLLGICIEEQPPWLILELMEVWITCC